MASKSKLIGYTKRKTPSRSPTTSGMHSKSLNPKWEVVKTTTKPTAKIQKNPDHSSPTESPEVQYLIYKLQGISISQEEFELSQDGITS